MATRVRKLSKSKMHQLVEAYDLSRSIEMANIPAACQDSAAASWAAANRPLQCWVRIQLDDSTPAIAYDLRFGHEAKERAK